jgi:hypothetical protein
VLAILASPPEDFKGKLPFVDFLSPSPKRR